LFLPEGGRDHSSSEAREEGIVDKAHCHCIGQELLEVMKVVGQPSAGLRINSPAGFPEVAERAKAEETVSVDRLRNYRAAE
jgi:hypothetical protein